MEADKNTTMLYKFLKIFGQKIRIDVLKILNASEVRLSFAKLQKSVSRNNLTPTNFSFHIKLLKEINLIDANEEGYLITPLGKDMLVNILSIELLLVNNTKSKMIRTSKYSKEPFNEKKIETFLVEEGELETFLAKKIAREVIARLSKLNIEYMTAPLIREYTNAILLENGLEEVRHKLTRLGTPPSEASKLFNNKIKPNNFLNILGSDVSEQYLLLNLLPKKLADTYLSGEIILLNLNYWALRPLGFYVNVESFINLVNNKLSIKLQNIKNLKEGCDYVLTFIDFLYRIKPYFSEDLVLGDFDSKFLFLFNSLRKEDIDYLNSILYNQLLSFNKSFEDKKNHITLEFCNNNNFALNDDINSKKQDNSTFLELFKNRYNNNYNSPLIVQDYSKLKLVDIETNFFKNLNFSKIMNNLIFYNKNTFNLINSSNIKVLNPDGSNYLNNNIILDKIFINLCKLSNEAKQNDDRFLDLIKEKVENMFELFEYKASLTKKKLNLLNGWNFLTKCLFNQKEMAWSINALKSISFLGLNEAIKTHCGIELDRLDTSGYFALKILSFINKLIEEKNNEENENYILSQPHPFEDRNCFRTNVRKSLKNNSNSTYAQIVRENSNLELERKISLFKKFENLINGGTIFNSSINEHNLPLENHLKTLFQSSLNAFSFY